MTELGFYDSNVRESVSFEIAVLAKPWQRATFDRRTGRYLTRVDTRHFEALVRDTAALRLGGSWRLDGAYELHVTCVLPNYATRDWDNLGKAVSDALNGVAYRDDNQVMDGRVTKRVDPLVQPYVVVHITRIGDWPVKQRARR
jgi:Holliday junction resolvase RusA-like endonuclease